MYKFDTFENEIELSKMIKKFQEQSIEYLKNQEPWEEVSDTPILKEA